MNINTGGIDNRFSQFPGGGQPTQNGVFSLGSAQNIPAGFAGLQQQQSRPGGLASGQQQPMMQQQQPLVVGPRSMQQQQYGTITPGGTGIANGLRSTSGALGGSHMGGGLSSLTATGQQQHQQLGGLMQQQQQQQQQRSMMTGSGAAATSLATSLQQQQQRGGLGTATSLPGGGGGGGMMMGGPRILGGGTGGAGPMGGPPLLQQQPGGYGGGGAPSGDLISMLNKAARQEDVVPPPPPPPPSFDASDFPSLSGTGGPGGLGGQRYGNGEGGPDSFANLLAQQQQQQKGEGMMGQPAAFGDEDFPALDGGGGGGEQQRQGGGGGGGGGGDSLEAFRQQHVRRQQQLAAQQQQQQQQAMMKGLSNLPPSSNMLGRAASTTAGGVGAAGQPDRFGLLGLLSVIRMTDPDLSLLALGSDLTSMGINLNDPNPIWKTQFETPWTDSSSSSTSAGQSKPELDVRAPQCYLMPPQRLQPGQLGKLQLDTLFYIFYGMPGDEAQALAADELTAKGWYFHKEIRTWLMRVPNTEPLQKTDRFERGSFFVFDPATWEVVRKDNMVIEFASLERAPGLAAARAAAAAAAAGGGGAGGMPQGAPAAAAVQ